MRGRLAGIGVREAPLIHGWNLVLTEPGVWTRPSDISFASQFIPAAVPGTVAQALEEAGLFDRENPAPLDGKDAWYVCRLFDEQPGPAILRFEGLATLCDVFLNGEEILSSESMFEAYDVAVDLNGGDELALCFRALEPRLSEPGPRARWRPRLVATQGLRLLRTTFLGRMPGWCPEIHAAGPWRPISVLRPGPVAVRNLSLRPELRADGEGRLHASLDLEGHAASVVLRCGAFEQSFSRVGAGQYAATLAISEIEPWWPHTHGSPRLYEVAVVIDGLVYGLGHTGFRRLAIERGAEEDGFRLVVNGEPVFCRGAVWTTADIAGLPGSRRDYERWLRLAAEAGMNMIRIGGTMAYETPAFFQLCDELGILVWQDVMLANFDYPKAEKGFQAHVETEVRQLLRATRASPSLALLCGGSEIYQQAAMFGLPERFWSSPLTEETLPAIAAEIRPDVPYLANTPIGGAMPFSPNAGVTHYFGVGAYLRPLEDARRAAVRFAAESLAFAHVPQGRTLAGHLPVPPVHSPLWKARVPRDRGASWDFEDVRDHYLRLLYGFEPDRLRREDPQFYLDLSRAVTGEVAEAVYAEWRRLGSTCNGALVWTLQDLMPGPGWGVIDSTGEPKPAWYGLRRAFRPIQLVFTDEGTNGLYAHVINETDRPLALNLDVSCLRDGRQPVVSGRRELQVAARGAEAIACTDLFGAFFDTAYAFRFGPPSHDVTVGRLRLRDTGVAAAEAFHFPLGRAAVLNAVDIEAGLFRLGEQWMLELQSDRLAQSIHIDLESYRAEDDWFHLAPGAKRRLKLLPRPGADLGVAPTGRITTLGSRQIFEI